MKKTLTALVLISLLNGCGSKDNKIKNNQLFKFTNMKQEKEMPQIIDAFIKAQNSHNSADFTALFTSDAEVYDEGQKYTGNVEIKKWNEETIKKYSTTNTLTNYEIIEDKIRLVLKVSGTFPGSPVNIVYVFTISEKKIKTLHIE
jgi:hypothetical protein